METVWYFMTKAGGEQFKSYYVVWKPKKNSRTLIRKMGLNRTM